MQLNRITEPAKGGLKHPIEVFDSGVGGLSIIKAMRVELPFEDFVCVSDSGYGPYGERSDDFVVARSRAIANDLMHHPERPIKALVIACNTATDTAIATLRQDYPDLPIIGVKPALKQTICISKTNRIGVLATHSTMNSHKFKTLLTSLAHEAEFICQPCDGLAVAIERDDPI